MMVPLLVMWLFAPCYLAPVAAPIAERYVAPACTYCAGHRGVEYDVASGTPVRAAADGVVTFAGSVARVVYVVVLHDDGIRATYGMVRTTNLVTGQRVAAGDQVAVSSDRLYFGLRRADDSPVDPEEYLERARRRARLVPADGSPPRPATRRTPTCPANGAGAATARSSAASAGEHR